MDLEGLTDMLQRIEDGRFERSRSTRRKRLLLARDSQRESYAYLDDALLEERRAQRSVGALCAPTDGGAGALDAEAIRPLRKRRGRW